MLRLLIFGAVWALAVAKPDLYKEKEDFQFSRSSSDDGTKSGFYGAQRGNMGGNYERAHNMDSLAQNQMSGLVRQVEGELGDGARTRTGSVYSAANSRGTYGSGHYDLSNLAGRNFQESNSHGDSQSHSSHSASASAYNAAYANSRSQSSRHNGYQATGYSGLNLQSDDLQALDNTQAAGQYDYGRQTSQATGYNAQSGYQLHAAYDTGDANLHSGGYGSSVNTRLISATPVRIIVRPGTRVAIPVAAQSYDLTHGSALIDQNSLNSDAENLNNDNQRSVYRASNPKHYESSYNYRKEWEKHSTFPSPTTTDNPFPKNSELYEDRQAHTANDQYDSRRVDSQRAQSSYGGYNAVKSTSGQSRLNYDSQRNGASHTNANAYSYGTNNQETSSGSSSNGYQSQYNAGRYHGATADSLTQAAHSANAAADLNSQVENLNTKPKSYQSAYSYHKSWERQGDPYVIKPASSGYNDGQSSQRLTSGAAQNLGYSATGSHYQHSHQSGVDCDENGHIRVARSSDAGQYREVQQQSQNLEDFSQQQQSQNLEDFSQQQQSQNLEDLSQQQQSQNLENFGQQQQSQNLEDFGQQQQNQNLADFAQQQYKQNLEDLHQKVDDLGQQSQAIWDPQEAGQQAQNTWVNLEQMSQQSENRWDDGQHVWDKFEDFGQQSQDINKQLTNVEQNQQNDLGQQTQYNKTELKNNSQDQQQSQNKWDFSGSQDEQQNVYTHDQANHFHQQETSQKHNNDQMTVWDKLNFGSHHVGENKFNSEHTNSNNNWSFVSQQAGLDQQPINSGSNADQSQSVHKVNKSSVTDQITSTHQVHKIPDTNEQSNTGYFNLHNGDFNLNTNQNQFFKDENSFLQTHKFHEGSNWYLSNTHRQEQTTNTESYSHAFEAISPNTAPLSSLWNKLGNIEQTSLTGTRQVDQGNILTQVHTSTQNSFENSMHAYHNTEGTLQEHLNSQIKPHHDLIPHIDDKVISENKSNDSKIEKESSLDVGRGDIGPEDLSSSKPDKYPTDMSVSSETIQNQGEYSVTNITTNTQYYNRDVQHHENTNRQNNSSQNENLPEQTSQFPQNVQHQNVYDSQEQKDAETREQQNLHVLSLHENIEHPNQTMQDSKKQHNEHDYENLEQQNLQSFGQQEIEKQTNIHNFEEQDNLEQHNLQDFGQQVNVEQQNMQDFGEHDNLEQQNLQDFGQQVNVEQQNLQDFGQQVNADQQNLQDFGQQVNVEQQNLQDFGQQVNVDQENLQDFGQHVNEEQQNLQDFGQQVNADQQNLQDFGQQVNVEQQNLQDFGQHVNEEQQNLQDFGQQVNADQQNLQDFGQQVNVEQQNLQDFGQQVNVDQENLQDFGQHVNVDQENLQDFGQQVNLEQQNLQDFGEQANVDQQNLQDFGQQVNVEQQNLQDFGQQPNVDQQNLHDFGQQDNLQQQNLQNFEQQNLQSFRLQDNLQQKNEKLEQLSQDPEHFKYSKDEQTTVPKNNVESQTYFSPPEVTEQSIVKKQNNDLQSISAQTPITEISPIEPVTESTGFWKSIGNKFSRAKSKISSWF